MTAKQEEVLQKRFRTQSLWVAVLTFELIVVGSLVRASNAGLACPDWPKCYGAWVPAMDWFIFLEWFHRAIALCLGGMLCALVWNLFSSIFLRKKYRSSLIAAGLLFLWQCVLGGLTVLKLLEPGIVTWHLGNALLFYSLVLWVSGRERLSSQTSQALSGWVFFSFLVLFQLTLGAAVSTSHAGLACPDFPTCQGLWWPLETTPLPMVLHLLHRGVAAVLVAMSLWLFWVESSQSFAARAIRRIFALLLIQGLLGWLTIVNELPIALSVLHFANGVVIFTYAWLTTGQMCGFQKENILKVSQKIGPLFQMTKPTITLLVVVTTIPGLLLALEPGDFPTLTILWGALIGAGLTSASAAVFNQVVEMDVDSQMQRTCGRSIPSGVVSEKIGISFGLLLLVLGESLLYFTTTSLAAGVALAGHLFYVLIYTMILKKLTVQNIVIGGAAGAVGPLIGWAAITGELSWPAWAMFAIIFLWTPPHFWSLAIKYKDDYKQAGIPMYPVVHGEEKTRRLIFLYTLSLLPVILFLAGYNGPLFFLGSMALTLIFIWKAWILLQSTSSAPLMPFFHYSCFYTFGVFGVLTLERLLVGIM
ncbi:MAG: heme o synthase [Oligoflexales bacterium]